MKKELLTVILLTELAVVPDAVIKDTVRVKKDGLKQYEIKKDVLIPGQYNIYYRRAPQVSLYLPGVGPSCSRWSPAHEIHA